MSSQFSRFFIVVFFSFFGAGFFPFAQGTFTSLIICFIYFFVPLEIPIELVLLFVLISVSFIFVPKVNQIWNQKDPSYVVIDEVIGMMITFLFLPKTILTLILGFVLFRFFDVLKIPPVNFFDKMQSPYGIILDDIIAGIMANILLRILIYMIY